MNRRFLGAALFGLAAGASASAQTHYDIGGTTIPAAGSVIGNFTSTLTLTSSTSAYSAGQLIANSATAGSVSVPSVFLPQGAKAALIPRLRVSINDATSTAWGGVAIQIDLWSAAPTFANGDRGAFLPATGAASHLGAYSCTMSAEYGDGVYAECAPNAGAVAATYVSASAIYWTAQTLSASGVTGASKTMTLTAEAIE